MAIAVETLIVGGGQAGLAVSQMLARIGREHLILERGTVGHAWRTQRWDSFRLVTPNHTWKQPGFCYDGADPEGFMSRTEIVGCFERLVARTNPPLRLGVNVKGLSRLEPRGFVLETGDAGRFTADNVVVATGPFQVPVRPPWHERLSPDVVQCSSQSYRNPSQLPAGAVLIVGSGQSGVQIAEELMLAGRRTFLAVGKRGWLPRRYLGRDITDWYLEMGLMDTTVSQFESLAAARASGFPQLAGSLDLRHNLNVHTLAARGVQLLGRAVSGEGNRLCFRQRSASIRRADEFAGASKEKIDAYIAGLPARPADEDPWPSYASIQDDGPSEIDLRKEQIRSIVWAVGYRVEFDWISAPVLNAQGYPNHRRGVTDVPGLYFAGLEWLHRRRSSLLLAGDEDAQHIASFIKARSA